MAAGRLLPSVTDGVNNQFLTRYQMVKMLTPTQKCYPCE